MQVVGAIICVETEKNVFVISIYPQRHVYEKNDKCCRVPTFMCYIQLELKGLLKRTKIETRSREASGYKSY